MTEKKAIEGTVEPGDTARCKVTKIDGIVVVRHDYLYGISRIGIQPEGSHEGKAHEAQHIDINQAELLEKYTVKRDGMIPKITTQLGDNCKDRISGFKGICTGLAEWLYACTKVMLTPTLLEKKKYEPAEAFWFDEPQVKVIKEKVMEEDSKDTGEFGKSVSSEPSNSSSSFKHS